MVHLPFFFIIAAFINPLAILIYAAILICITLKHKRCVPVVAVFPHYVNHVNAFGQ